VSRPNSSTSELLVLRAESAEDVVRAATMLRDGSVLVVPTETLYGLAASIFHPQAIGRVLAMKERTPVSPLPVLIGSASDLPLLSESIPRLAWRLIELFWPGALTLTLPARPGLHPALTGGGSTVACRVPASRSCLEMLEALGAPITGTSANRSGFPPSARGLDAAGSLSAGPDAVLLDDSQVSGGPASTVVELRDAMIVVHREGAVGIEDLRRGTGARVVTVETLEDLTYRG
jgi:L-threonylcarbamoyladenylate synthase